MKNLKKYKSNILWSILILIFVGINLYLKFGSKEIYFKDGIDVENLKSSYASAKNFVADKTKNIFDGNKDAEAAAKDKKTENEEKYVNVFKVKKIDFKDSLSNLIGTIEGTNFSIKVDQEETVDKIYFKPGDFVKKDDLILELNHTKTRAELTKAKIEYEKSNELFKVGGASKFLLEAAAAELKVAERNYDNTFIKAPSDGFIGEILIKEGEFAVKYKPIIRFVNAENEFYIKTKVIEKKLPLLNGQNKVNIKLNFLENPIQGFVMRVSPEIDPFSRMADVYIKTEDGYKKYLKPGMSAELEIMVFDKNTIIIPISCLADGLKNGKVFIVDKRKKAKDMKVKLGYKTRDYIEVLAGLNENSLVITDVEKSKIADGDKLIFDRPKEYEAVKS